MEETRKETPGEGWGRGSFLLLPDEAARRAPPDRQPALLPSFAPQPGFAPLPEAAPSEAATLTPPGPAPAPPPRTTLFTSAGRSRERGAQRHGAAWEM